MATTTKELAHAGRIALVTGAARGIGQAIAVGLAERGAYVVVGEIEDLSETTGRVAATGRAVLRVRLDISDPASIAAARDRVVDDLGRADILVNNAAIFETATWDDLDFELWHRVMAVNLNGPMLVREAFLPLFRGKGWSRGQTWRSSASSSDRSAYRPDPLATYLTSSRSQ